MEEEKVEATPKQMEEDNLPSFTSKGSPRLMIRQMVGDPNHFVAKRIQHQNEAFLILIRHALFSSNFTDSGKFQVIWR